MEHGIFCWFVAKWLFSFIVGFLFTAFFHLDSMVFLSYAVREINNFFLTNTAASSPAALQPTTDYCKDTAQICFVFMNALE